MQKRVTFGVAKDLKYPEAVAIAIAKDPQGKYNPITLGWCMQTSHKPAMWAISVGLTRYSHEALEAAEGFVLAFPSEHQEAETMHFGTRSGRDEDKIAVAAATTQPAEEIDGVLLADAVANFECRKAGSLLSGDHTIFVGEVVCSHVNEQELNRLYTVAPGWKIGGLGRG